MMSLGRLLRVINSVPIVIMGKLVVGAGAFLRQAFPGTIRVPRQGKDSCRVLIRLTGNSVIALDRRSLPMVAPFRATI